MQEDCGGGGNLDTSSINSAASSTTPTPLGSVSTGGTSPRPHSDDIYAASVQQHHGVDGIPTSVETSSGVCLVGINGNIVNKARVAEALEAQSIVGNVTDLNLGHSVASLWSEDDQNQLINPLNGSIGYGGNPQLFGGNFNTGFGRIGANTRSFQSQQQPNLAAQRGVMTGPSAALGPSPVPACSGNYLGQKGSNISWSSNFNQQANAWSSAPQGIMPASQGQTSSVGPPSWGRGRPSNMSHNLGSLRGIPPGQISQGMNLGKISPGSMSANMKIRRSTSFPGKPGLPQGSPYSQMHAANMQSHPITPTFEFTGAEDPREYQIFQVSQI